MNPPPNSHRRVKWTNPQIEKLIHYAELYNKNWLQVAAEMKIKSTKQCKQKYLSLISNLKRGRWTDQEDALIRGWVVNRGAINWTECAKQFPNRGSKQCRERWMNILNPVINKGEWTPMEQQKIFEGVYNLWNRWKTISAMVPGRTPNAVKNFVNSSLRSIKNSMVLKFIKIMIIHPSYVNKSRQE